MNLDANFVLQVVVALVPGVGVYAAIRADLARLHERANIAKESADQAHKRIDTLMRHTCN